MPQLFKKRVKPEDSAWIPGKKERQPKVVDERTTVIKDGQEVLGEFKTEEQAKIFGPKKTKPRNALKSRENSKKWRKNKPEGELKSMQKRWNKNKEKKRLKTLQKAQDALI